MPTLTGTIDGVTGVRLDPARIRQVYVRAPLERASVAEESRLISSASVSVPVSPAGQISINLEPGPAMLVIEHDSRDVYELHVTADMTLLTQALAESAPDRSWVESQMVQLKAGADEAAEAAATAAGMSHRAANYATDARDEVELLRAQLVEAAEQNAAPHLTTTALSATYVRDRPQEHAISEFAPMDGVALDDGGVVAALAAMNPGDRLTAGGRTLKLSGTVVIDKPVNVDFTGLAIVQPANTPTFEFLPGASGSTWTGGTATGAGTTYQGNAKFFHLLGEPGNPVTDLTFTNVSFSNIGSTALWAEHAQRVDVINPKVDDLGYAGFIFRSSQHCWVLNPRIRRLVGRFINTTYGGVMQSYGVAFSRDSVKDIATHPNSTDCGVMGGSIEDTDWEALDTHGGRRITFWGTKIRRTRHAVACVPCPDQFNYPVGDNHDKWAPRDIIIGAIDADSEKEDGSMFAGIRVVGAGTLAETRELATASIVQCELARYGKATDVGSSGAIQAYLTSGLTISGTAARRSGGSAVHLYYKNHGFSIDNLVAEDTWGTGGGSAGPSVAYVRSEDNQGSFGRMVARSTGWVPPSGAVNANGIAVATNTNALTLGGPFDFSAVTTPFNGGLLAHRVGLGRATPSALAALPAAATDAATAVTLANAMRTQLIAKGIAT